jgi:hypothetical protein
MRPGQAYHLKRSRKLCLALASVPLAMGSASFPVDSMTVSLIFYKLTPNLYSDKEANSVPLISEVTELALVLT